MTIAELKETLRELIGQYFPGAIITYTKQSFKTKPTVPLITLTMGAVNRPLRPPTKYIAGYPVSFYPATVPVQIDLFTQGRLTQVKEGYTPIAENTACDDLLQLVNFLNSDYSSDYCHNRDIAIVVPPTVTDLTDIINDTQYQFRAMTEIEVYFTMTAIGYTRTVPESAVKYKDDGSGGSGGDIQSGDVVDIIPDKPEENYSGGGSKELLETEGKYFEDVEINNRLQKRE